MSKEHRQNIQNQTNDAIASPTRAKIAAIFNRVVELVDDCFDFQIGEWLDRYYELKEDPNFIEIGFLIANASSIYGRKVDLLHHLAVQFSQKVVKNDQEITPKNDSDQSLPKESSNKLYRNVKSLNNGLYEADMTVKEFKTIPLEKTMEVLSSFKSLEPPNNYFQNWRKYKDWRKHHKKKMKGNAAYSMDCGENFIHPDLWKSSCIEDFEFDDCKESKRNFRIFTYYTEHRYSTLVPDINFVMHFKVKDFIEAEEDEIQVKKTMGLEPPAARKWPPFCKAYDQEIQQEEYHDYLTEYIALEDEVIQKESGNTVNYECHKNVASGNIKELADNLRKNTNDIFNPTVKNLQTNIETVENQTENCSHTNKPNSETENLINPQGLVTTNEKHDNRIDLSTITPKQSILTDSGIQTPMECDSINENTDHLVEGNNLTDDLYNNDEGVYFDSLDEVDKVMLSPTVQLTDIFKPYPDGIHSLPPNIVVEMNATKKKNIFEIEDMYLNYEEEFQLPLHCKIKKPCLRQNFLCLPLKKLQKKLIFALPSVFKTLKKDKTIRKEKPSNKPPRVINLAPNIEQKPSDTQGCEIENCIDPFEGQNILSSTLNNEIDINSLFEKHTQKQQQRTLSSDSGFDSEMINDAKNKHHSELENFNSNNLTEANNLDNETDNNLDNDFNHMNKRIQDWHRRLKPIIENSKSRHHFDIHELGTEIINKFPENSNFTEETVTFETIMKDKMPSTTSRYFFSMLQLANTNNIGIHIENQSDQEPTPFKNIHLKLLSRNRSYIFDKVSNVSPLKKNKRKPPTIACKPSCSKENLDMDTSIDKLTNMTPSPLKIRRLENQSFSNETNFQCNSSSLIQCENYLEVLNDSIIAESISSKCNDISSQSGYFIYPKRVSELYLKHKSFSKLSDIDSGIFSQNSFETSDNLSNSKIPL